MYFLFIFVETMIHHSKVKKKTKEINWIDVKWQ